ncbi:MAG: hypothetical protein EOP86_15380 [Verrucomicrobiaceae bacterium]|nr:MAG: hypothetical protein EOP86_15380 [Verrucomicrobiaceae bacterium]
MGKTGSKHIVWDTVSAEDWAKGCNHVARLMGVTPSSAAAARKRLGIPPRPASRPPRPVPEGLKPTDSPTTVALRHGVRIQMASKWLASVGRPPAGRGRPQYG